jgi:hypothetical protein
MECLINPAGEASVTSKKVSRLLIAKNGNCILGPRRPLFEFCLPSCSLRVGRYLHDRCSHDVKRVLYPFAKACRYAPRYDVAITPFGPATKNKPGQIATF